MSANADCTVVITCFDYGRYLTEAVDSALQQEGGPPQVVVVDDGSTDPGTLEVLHALEQRVDVVRRPNGGLPRARNTGLERAATPYVLVLDADDKLAPGALRALRAELDADPALGFAYGIVRFFGDWEGEMKMPPFDAYGLLYRHTIGSTALMRAELLADVEGYDPAFTNGYEDWEFWLHALACGWRGRKLETDVLYYRRHGSTMLSAARSGYRSWYRALRAKHAGLYRMRRRLAKESSLGPLQRAVYRWFWGPRPVPARVEALIYSRVFGGR